MAAKDNKRRLISAKEATIREFESLFNHYNDFVVDDDDSFEELSVIKDELSNIRIKFDKAHSALSEISNVDANEHWQNTSRFISFSATINIKLKNFIRRTEQARVVEVENPTPVNPVPIQTPQQTFRLPEICLPKFDGKFQDWLHFRDTFTSIIINNTSISDATKFYYLRQSLTADAKARIQNIPPGDANFLVAWQLLIDRFDNTRMIATSHITALDNPPQPAKNCPQSLRSFIDHFQGNINALESLDLGIDIKDLLYSHKILSHLDASTLSEWEQHAAADTIPSLQSLWEFLEARCKIWEIVSANSNIPSSNQLTHKINNNQGNKGIKTNNTANMNTSLWCPFCKDKSHNSFNCKDFLKLKPTERLAKVKQLKLCYNCLKSFSTNHICSPKRCMNCNQKHHSLLHQAFNQNNYSRPQNSTVTNIVESSDSRNSRYTSNEVNNSSSNSINNQASSSMPVMGNVDTSQQSESIVQFDQNSNTVNANACSSPTSSFVTCILPTAEVLIQKADGKFLKCVALLDTGSDCNLIHEELASQLHLTHTTSDTCIQGVGNGKITSTKLLSINIKSQTCSWSSQQKCLVVPKISSNVPKTTVNLENLDIPSSIALADPNFNISRKVDLLLGATVVALISTPGQISLSENSPLFQNSKLGWLVMGPCMQKGTPVQTNTCNSNFIETLDVQTQLEKFWKLEELNKSVVSPTAVESCVEEHYIKHTYRQNDGRFVVSLPLKDSPTSLGHSRPQAVKRLLSLENRLAKDQELSTQYSEFMTEYSALGHMSTATNIETDEPVYYIPHHPVFKPDSTTTKVRVVFDASAKTSNGTSLNSILHVGPTVQPELFEIILRFRMHKIAFIADIAKMYRQIRIDPSYHNLQRILWRSSSNEPIQEFCLETVTYGTASAAYLATRTLNELAKQECNNSTSIQKLITNDFYVDDLISGSSSTTEAIDSIQEVIQILDKGGFELRKWLSNSQEVQNSIPAHLREESSSKLVSTADDNITKALGLIWNASNDTMSITSNVDSIISKSSFTKRQLLSCIASIFDPLGLISPVVISAKMLFQTLWLLKLDWDDKLPPDLLTSWLTILQSLPSISYIKIPRCACPATLGIFEIHGFCDASNSAYGACIYIRSVNSNGEIFVRLLCAKSKVKPLKIVSIPRLELCAALLLSRLTNKVLKALDMKASTIHLWTDSNNVLAWLRAPPDSKNIFVGLRVDEIQETTSNCFWNHVKSKENPADLISRGTTPNDLCRNTSWWNGPLWLSTQPFPLPSSESKITLFTSSYDNASHSSPTLANSELSSLFDTCSTHGKMIRCAAYVLRFINNTRRTQTKLVGPISTVELQQAEHKLVSILQAKEFSNEIKFINTHGELNAKNSLQSLAPFIHSDGLLRVGGRLQHSNLSFNAKHQILLPSKHKFTKALVIATHLRLLHAGTHSVMSDIRQNYWIPSTRTTIRNILRCCLSCFRFKPTAITQQMGQLPHVRVNIDMPFRNCGIDYAGPFLIKHGGPRSKTVIKAYLALFICMATRAVHAEIVTDLTTKAFFAALTRFIARRGLPKNIYSDNGTNFLGAQRELKNLFEFLTQSKTQRDIQLNASKLQIHWHFIPPRAPHFGGLWEAAIKSFKRIFRVVTLNRTLSLEEAFTLSSQVEAILNSRPITPLTEDPLDLSLLSPGHFLIGRPLTALPDKEENFTKLDYNTRWRRVAALSQDIWQQWSTSYLATLQKRQKWHSSMDNLTVGTLVLLKDLNSPMSSWRLGRITELFPGLDGKVRVVAVLTNMGPFKRAISSIVPLPIDEN